MQKAVHWTQPAGVTPHLGREEAEARHQHYIGPEHLLVGLLRQREHLDQVDAPPPERRPRGRPAGRARP
jgi:hypothetical protein